MSNIRGIGIATGGGDAPGLNAVIRAATKAAILKYKWKVIGIPDGFDGLIWPEKSFELRSRKFLESCPAVPPSSGSPAAAILSNTRRARIVEKSAMFPIR